MPDTNSNTTHHDRNLNQSGAPTIGCCASAIQSRFKMEGNKDESEKCLKIARKLAAAGDKEKAIKFVLKADKLFPSKKAQGKNQSGIEVKKLRAFPATRLAI